MKSNFKENMKLNLINSDGGAVRSFIILWTDQKFTVTSPPFSWDAERMLMFDTIENDWYFRLCLTCSASFKLVTEM